jgi:MFS family permease
MVLIPQQPAPNFMAITGTSTRSYSQGLITSMLLLGGFASNILVESLADRFGRRYAILAGCIIFLIGGAFQTAAQGLGWMCGVRSFAGVGVGMFAMLAPLYQSEMISCTFLESKILIMLR